MILSALMKWLFLRRTGNLVRTALRVSIINTNTTKFKCLFSLCLVNYLDTSFFRYCSFHPEAMYPTLPSTCPLTKWFGRTSIRPDAGVLGWISRKPSNNWRTESEVKNYTQHKVSFGSVFIDFVIWLFLVAHFNQWPCSIIRPYSHF